MSASYYVVKGPSNGAAGQTQVSGFNRTRYDSFQSGYGTLPAETKGSFFYFGQVPTKKIIGLTLVTVETTPVTVTFGPSAIATALQNGTALSITANSGSTVKCDYVISYDNLYSGAVGQILIVQVN